MAASTRKPIFRERKKKKKRTAALRLSSRRGETILD